ncbi:tetratricopeptide repeat protein [Morganella psychrotolerans]|uniref:Uncharacterized protein n=1 Tax=Morganella psychrotolerans TaxID=368603 RepID=A0A1B8HNQ3_9GAMM|nr:tetratricopeptide repeat protein [Morganella psychrotolerans]OBU10861.1 hypothetical protein AYY18_02630 [Morganella psychrotolerans]
MDDNINCDIKSLVENIFSHLESGNIADLLVPKKEQDFTDVYSLACDYYDKGLIEQAENIFRSLCLYDFSNVDYLLGLAAVKQVQKQYQKAINLYCLAINLDETNASIYLYIGQCYLYTGEKESAISSFRHCLSLACNDSEREQATNYISILGGN